MNIIDPKLRFTSLEYIDLDKIDGIALHHAKAVNYSVYQCHEGHIKDNNWKGIGYAFYVEKNGNVYLGRGFYKNAGVANNNSHLISVCFEGDFDIELMSPEQFYAGVNICKYILEKCKYITKIGGHKEWNDTSCPGEHFPINSMVNDIYINEEENYMLEDRVKKLEAQNRIYHWFDELPEWAEPTIRKLYDRKIYAGNGPDDLDLPETLMRVLVINDRAGIYK